MGEATTWQTQKFGGQHENETVQLVFHQHPVVMRRHLIAALAALTISSLPLAIWPLNIWPRWVFLGGFVLGILIFAYRYLGWHFSIFIVTNERLIQIRQRGFFDRKVIDISHDKIQSVNYEIKGMQATLFHFGTIIVQTYVGEIVLQFIHQPENVHELLVKMIHGSKQPVVREQYLTEPK